MARFELRADESGRRRCDGCGAKGLTPNSDAMALYPQSFIDDLKHHADIIVVIQDYVSLKKARAPTTWVFAHFTARRRRPSASTGTRGLLLLLRLRRGRRRHQVSRAARESRIPDAVKQLAQRFGMTIPEQNKVTNRRRVPPKKALLKVHEVALAWFREQLLSPAGTRIRRQIAERGIADATAEAMGLGFAPPSRTAMKEALSKQGFGGSVTSCWPPRSRGGGAERGPVPCPD